MSKRKDELESTTNEVMDLINQERLFKTLTPIFQPVFHKSPGFDEMMKKLSSKAQDKLDEILRDCIVIDPSPFVPFPEISNGKITGKSIVAILSKNMEIKIFIN